MFYGARLRRLQIPALVLVAIPLTLSSFSLSAHGQTVQWVRQFGTNAEDRATGVATNSSGVYVVGYTTGALPGQSNAGSYDAYVRKYDANGTEQWTRQFGTVSDERAYAVAADATGVYVMGRTTGSLPGQVPAGGVYDVFIRRYDTSGNEVWTRQFGTQGNEEGFGVGLNSTGVYVAGYTTGTFPGQTAGSTGGADAFLRTYDLSGNELWTRQFGTASTDQAYGVAADSTGVYVAGRTNGPMEGSATIGAFDAFLRKYDPSGNVVWTRQVGTVSNDDGWAVAANSSGVYVAGRTSGVFAGQTSASPGISDAFVRKYNANGVEQWTRQFGSTGQDEALGAVSDATGVSVVGTANFVLPGLPPNTIGHAFARRYDANGTEQSTQQFGSGGNDVALAVAGDAAGTFVAGYTNGGIPGQTFLGSSDAFVLQISTPSGQISLGTQSLQFTGFVGGSTQRQALQIGTSRGTLSWKVTAKILNGTGWLVVTPPSGTATATTPSQLPIEVNFGAFATAGIYQAVIVIEDTGSGNFVRLPITAVASPGGSRLLLSQSSFLFRTVVGGTAPAQVLRVGNGGQGSMSWTIPAPQSWLGISSLSGTASAGGASATTLSINTAGLSAGVYQQLVQVSAAGAANNPLLVTVTLHVAPAATSALPELSSHGILIAIREGAAVIPSFDLVLRNAGGGTSTFQLQAATESGGNWLTISSASGSIGPEGTSVSIRPALAALTPGVYRARLTATFTPGGTLEVEVVLVYAEAPVIPLRNAPGAALCAPSSMEMVVNSIGTGSVAPVSFPRPLLATVVDSCGNPLSDATVVAAVESRNIALAPLGDGLFSGTWTPEQQAGAVPLTFTALHPTYPTVQRTVTVSTAAAAGGTSLPVLFPGGVVEAAGYTLQRPLAPGGIVSLFGSSFAAADTPGTHLPLDRTLGGVQVRIGGEDAPLYYAGSGQINAQVPYSVQPGNEVSVAMSVNGQFAAPQTYLVAPVQPGIFLVGDGGAILDGQSRPVNASNPAQRGDVLQIFATGLGQTDPPAQTGEGAPSFSQVLLPVTVTVGGVEAPAVYQGLAPDYVGLYQVNVRLPTTVTPGDNVEVVIQQNGISSNPDRPATIPVR